MKISTDKFFVVYFSFVIWLFAGLSALISYTPFNYSVQYALAGIGSLCALWLVIKYFRVLDRQVVITLGMMMVFCVIRTSRTSVETLVLVIMFLLCMCSAQIAWMQPMIKVLFASYIIYLAATIIFCFTPDFYLNTIVNLFPKTSRRLTSWYIQGYMSGLTNHYSTNAIFLCTGFLFSISLCLSKAKEKRKPILLIAAAFFVGILLTGKRGPLIFAIAAVYGLYYFSNLKGHNRIVKTIGVILISLCALVVLISMFPALSGALVRFQETSSQGDILMGRYSLWTMAWKQFLEHPIFGIGWGRFYTDVSFRYDYTNYYHVHNTYIQLLCETGLIGSLFYFSWMFLILKKTIHIYQKIEKWQMEKALMGFSLSFQLFFLLYSLTGNTFYEEEVAVPYFIACGLSMYFERRWRRGVFKRF